MPLCAFKSPGNYLKCTPYLLSVRSSSLKGPSTYFDPLRSLSYLPQYPLDISEAFWMLYQAFLSTFSYSWSRFYFLRGLYKYKSPSTNFQLPHLQFSRLPYLFQDLFYFHGDCPNSLKDLPDPFNELVSPSLTPTKATKPPSRPFSS